MHVLLLVVNFAGLSRYDLLHLVSVPFEVKSLLDLVKHPEVVVQLVNDLSELVETHVGF